MKDMSSTLYPRQWIQRNRTLSYHRFVHVPTCSPPCKLYVPHKKLLHKSARFSGEVSSKQTINSASSTTLKHEALLRSLASIVRSWDQTLRFSVERTPTAPRATLRRFNTQVWVHDEGRRPTSDLSTLSASLTMACRFRNTSRSVNKGKLLSSSTSNQSGDQVRAFDLMHMWKRTNRIGHGGEQRRALNGA